MIKCEPLEHVSDEHILCENCGGYFLKKPGRGRPPKVCEWSKEHNNTGKFKPVIQSEEGEVSTDTTTKKIYIPILQPVDVDKIKVGDTLFSKPIGLFKKDISQRRFARPYSILDITESCIQIKNGTEKFTITKDYAKERLYTKIGSESISTIDDERVINE